MNRVKNKVVVVTGGASGIGQTACRLLAEEGAKVAVTDINENAGQETVAQIQTNGGIAEFWQMDTTNEENVKQSMKSIAETFVSINVLVNNAGIAGTNKLTHEITVEEWDHVMDVNVKGVFFCTKHAIPNLKQAKGGSIINISSIYGLLGTPDFPPYHAAKGAVRLMSKTDAMLYIKDNIRVNSIHPGFIWTALVEALAQESEEGYEIFRQKRDQLSPIGHVGEPKDIAYGILYLASDESKYITASELVIDGGFSGGKLLN